MDKTLKAIEAKFGPALLGKHHNPAQTIAVVAPSVTRSKPRKFTGVLGHVHALWYLHTPLPIDPSITRVTGIVEEGAHADAGQPTRVAEWLQAQEAKATKKADALRLKQEAAERKKLAKQQATEQKKQHAEQLKRQKLGAKLTEAAGEVPATITLNGPKPFKFKVIVQVTPEGITVVGILP